MISALQHDRRSVQVIGNIDRGADPGTVKRGTLQCTAHVAPSLAPLRVPSRASHASRDLQLGDVDAPITGYNGQPTTIIEFLSSYFSYKYSFRWQCVAIVAAYILVFRLGSILAIKYISFQKR